MQQKAQEMSFFTGGILSAVFYDDMLSSMDTNIVQVMKEVICDTSINNCHKPIKLYLFLPPPHPPALYSTGYKNMHQDHRDISPFGYARLEQKVGSVLCMF